MEKGTSDLSLDDASWGLNTPACLDPCIAQPAPLAGDETPTTGAPRDRDGFTELAEFLREMARRNPDPSVDEVARAIEEHAPELRSVAQYLRDNHLSLAAVSLSFLAVIVAMCQWLLPRPPDESAPAPDGITQEQMDRLLEELRRDGPSPSIADQQEAKGNRRKKEAEGHGSDRTRSGGGGG